MALQNFIVLGIIPGTDIRINFQIWLAVMLLAVLAFELRRLSRSNVYAALLLKRAFHKSDAANLARINDISI